MKRALILLVAAFGLAACGEAEQVVIYEQGKYQGKPDTAPWGSGEHASWEEGIKARQLTQNEYRRIYQ